jgi:hypothetical protein
MRSDMHRVLTEPPRRPEPKTTKAKRKNRRMAKLDPEGAAAPSGMKQLYAGMQKRFSDHEQPLRRYLRRQVGRPWALVYSELSQNLRANSTHGNHLRSHVHRLVATRVTNLGGRFHDATCGLSQSLRPGDLYVDPRTGLLCRLPDAPRRKRQPNPRPQPLLRVACAERPELQFFCWNNSWLRVELRHAPASAVTQQRWKQPLPAPWPDLLGALALPASVGKGMRRQWDACKLLFGGTLWPHRTEECTADEVRQSERKLRRDGLQVTKTRIGK